MAAPTGDAGCDGQQSPVIGDTVKTIGLTEKRPADGHALIVDGGTTWHGTTGSAVAS